MLLNISPGSDVKFYAIIPVGVQYRLACLTPALSCLLCASDGRDRRAPYAAFIAASVQQAGIIQDTERHLTTPTAFQQFPGCADTARPTRITTSGSKYGIFMSNRATACSTSPRPATGAGRTPSSSSSHADTRSSCMRSVPCAAMHWIPLRLRCSRVAGWRWRWNTSRQASG